MKLKATELRLGNSVLDSIGIPKEVSLDVLSNIRKGLDYEGIPFSIDILKRCGLSQDQKHGYLFLTDTSYRFALNDSGLLHCSIGDNNNGIRYNVIRYVHQLQNLMFAVSNEDVIFDL